MPKLCVGSSELRSAGVAQCDERRERNKPESEAKGSGGRGPIPLSQLRYMHTGIPHDSPSAGDNPFMCKLLIRLAREAHDPTATSDHRSRRW